MAKYFRQDISKDEALPRPSLEELQALRLAKAQPVINTIRAQDRVVTLGRRILCEQALGGQIAWLTPDTNPDAATNTHPDKTTTRYVARSRIELTPGCMLALSVVCGLSGQTQRFVGAGNYDPDGAIGLIGVEVTWRDSAGGSATTTHELPLPASLFQWGAATPGTDGAQWAALRVLELHGITPEPLGASSDVNQWTLPTTVDIAIYNVGGARVVDAVVFEEPREAAYEADDTANRWVSHAYGAEPGAAGPAITHPFQRLSETTPDGDPRGGTWHLMDVANNQSLRLGPCLIAFSAYDEDDNGIAASEATAIQTSSSTFVGLPNTSLTGYDASNQGWSLSAGGYAAPYKHNHARAVGHNRVIPVRVRLYAAGSIGPGGDSPGVFRIQSAADSYIDITIPTGGTYGWLTAYGYLRCGQGPGDDSVVQAFFRRSSGAGGVSVRYFDVYRSGNFTTPI